MFRRDKKTASSVFVNNCNNKFSEFLDDVQETDENYDEVVEVTSLCSESLDILSKKMNFLERMKENSKVIDEITSIDHVEEEDMALLNKLCERYELLKRDNTSLMYQVTSFNGNVSSLNGKDKDALKNLPKLKEAEHKKSVLEQDIAILESERYKLYDQFDIMTNALNVTKNFSLGMIFMAVIFSFMLAYIQIFKNISVFYPLLVIVILLMLFITFVYIFRIRTARELKKNNKKQARLITLQNKKTAVLANTKNYLNFAYLKYSVKSTEELEENLKEYTKLKNAQIRKNSTRRALLETEEEIKEFFINNKIKMPDAPIEKLYSIVQIKDKKRQYENLLMEQKRIEGELDAFEVRQDAIWNRINEIKEKDVTERKLIGEIVKAYHSKAEKQLKMYDK